MEISNSYMSQFYAASMYMSNNNALMNAYQSAQTNSNGTSSSTVSFPADSDSMPARRLDRSDPASPNLTINVYGTDGRTLPGVMQRPDVTLGNSPVLPSELSSDGLPDRPELLFTHLANGLFGQNAEAVSQNLEQAQEYSSQLSSDAQNMKDVLQTLAEDSLLVAEEITQDGSVSDETADHLTDAASRFADRYNTTMETLAASPNQSRQAASVERVMESAVTNNSDELSQMGITQNSDGTLNFDEDRFRQAIDENPQSIQNMFNQNSDLAQGVNRAMDVAENTRVMRNAELSSALPAAQPFSTYPATVQSSSLVSMASVPSGYFLNRLA